MNTRAACAPPRRLAKRPGYRLKATYAQPRASPLQNDQQFQCALSGHFKRLLPTTIEQPSQGCGFFTLIPRALPPAAQTQAFSPRRPRLAKRKTTAPKVQLSRSRDTRSVIECGSLHRFGRNYKTRPDPKQSSQPHSKMLPRYMHPHITPSTMPFSTHSLLANNKTDPVT